MWFSSTRGLCSHFCQHNPKHLRYTFFLGNCLKLQHISCSHPLKIGLHCPDPSLPSCVVKRRSDTQTDQITRLHLGWTSLLLSSSQFPRPAPAPSVTPPASLCGYFHSPKCWVTTGSTSSQQSGLKFHEIPDAYFIVLYPLSITLHPPDCPSLLTSPLCAQPLESGSHRS